MYKTQVKELREELDEKSVMIAELEDGRNSLNSQMQAMSQKLETESAAIVKTEESVALLEKEKTMKELEIADLVSRHAQEISNKDNLISTVRIHLLFHFEFLLLLFFIFSSKKRRMNWICPLKATNPTSMTSTWN